MLAADKDALRQDLRVHMLDIQKRELDYITNNLSCMSTASAVLLGFAITLASSVNEISPNTSGGGGPPVYCLDGFLSGANWGSAPGVQNCPMPWQITYTFDGLFALFTGGAVGCNLITLFLSSTCLMAGPGLALRGPEGSLLAAVRHMDIQNKRALRYFGRGIVSFAGAVFFLGVNFALYDQGPWRGLILCFTMVTTMWVMLSYGSDIMEKFYVSPDRAVRGMFVSGRDGQVEWVRTPEEQARGSRGRPPGHWFFTPLYRLDKILNYPYYDASHIAKQAAETSMKMRRSGSNVGQSPFASFSTNERNAVDVLLRRNQGDPLPADTAASPDPDVVLEEDFYQTAFSAIKEIFNIPTREEVDSIPSIPPARPAGPLPSVRAPDQSQRLMGSSIRMERRPSNSVRFEDDPDLSMGAAGGGTEAAGGLATREELATEPGGQRRSSWLKKSSKSQLLVESEEQSGRL